MQSANCPRASISSASTKANTNTSCRVKSVARTKSAPMRFYSGLGALMRAPACLWAARHECGALPYVHQKHPHVQQRHQQERSFRLSWGTPPLSWRAATQQPRMLARMTQPQPLTCGRLHLLSCGRLHCSRSCPTGQRNAGGEPARTRRRVCLVLDKDIFRSKMSIRCQLY